jgi:hypothetical protein
VLFWGPGGGGSFFWGGFGGGGGGGGGGGLVVLVVGLLWAYYGFVMRVIACSSLYLLLKCHATNAWCCRAIMACRMCVAACGAAQSLWLLNTKCLHAALLCRPSGWSAPPTRYWWWMQ